MPGHLDPPYEDLPMAYESDAMWREFEQVQVIRGQNLDVPPRHMRMASTVARENIIQICAEGMPEEQIPVRDNRFAGLGRFAINVINSSPAIALLSPVGWWLRHRSPRYE